MQAPAVAIALLSFRPDERQVLFYEGLVDRGYSVFIFNDDTEFVIPSSDRAAYLKIDEQHCMNRGYFLLNPFISTMKRTPVSAWERAPFFFGKNHRRFDHV
jgi:hypothetical protein